MAYLKDKGFLLDIALGNVSGFSLVHKFGLNAAVSTSIVPVCSSGTYQTPTSAQSLEILSSSASDDDGSTGATKVTIQGLDASWNEQTEEVTMDGTNAVALSNTFIRVYRLWVSESGSYANATTPSQVGTITLRGSGGGSTWATIEQADTNFGSGQSLIGAYTVPAGKTAYILSKTLSVDSNKACDLYFFKREDANDVSSQYTGVMRLQNIFVGATGVHEITHVTNESFPEYTDIGFMAKCSTTSDVAVEFELLIKDN